MEARVILYVFLVIILLLIGGLTSTAVSGRVNRSYAVLPETTELTVAGETKPIVQWAADYQPVMILEKGHPSPPLLRVHYNGIAVNPQIVTFVYYLVWEDEIHPNPVYHALYQRFRAAYYGYPVRDIEFIQVKVDRQTGQVSELLFETSPTQDFFVVISKHILARIKRVSGEEFVLSLSERDGQVISSETPVEVCFKGQRPLLAVATWNHLTKLADCDAIEAGTVQKASLTFLSDDAFASGKYVRKSQGDYKTVESLPSKLMGGFAFLVVFLPFFLIIQFIGQSRKFRKKNGPV